jgi:hypothetical protein
LWVQRHLSALAGCESARLACHPSIRLPQNDRPSENDRKESGSGLTRILLALQSLAANQSCVRWQRRSSCLSQVRPWCGGNAAGGRFATSVNVGWGPTSAQATGIRDRSSSHRRRLRQGVPGTGEWGQDRPGTATESIVLENRKLKGIFNFL